MQDMACLILVISMRFLYILRYVINTSTVCVSVCVYLYMCACKCTYQLACEQACVCHFVSYLRPSSRPSHLLPLPCRDLLDRRPSASASRTPDPPSLPPGSPLLLGFPFPPHPHYPPRIPALLPQYALGGPLSPPISPLLLPPHPWLPVADPVDASPMEGGGVRPLAPWGVAELSRAAPSAFLPAAAAAAASAPPGHPFFISSLLTTGAGPLPPALDLSKRKGDT